MEKKGDTWVSSAMYILLGLIVISILLTSFLPLINKMKDKNTFIQTKNLMNNLDNTIKETLEGAGSQREFFLDMQRGDFQIDSENDKITWRLNTNAKIIEITGPDKPFREGDLIIFADESKGYSLNVVLDLGSRGIDLVTLKTKILNLKGQYNLIIKNNGVVNDKTEISISV